MSDKTMLVIPEELVKKIDTHRGNISRVQFIDLLIDTVLGQEVKKERVVPLPKREAAGKGWPEAEEYVTHREFEEFRDGIKDLQRTFIEFIITYGMELARKPSASGELLQAPYVTKDELQEFKRDVNYLLRVSLDFLITFDMELGTTEPTVYDHYQRSGIKEYRQNLLPVESEKPEKPEELRTASFPQAYCLKCRKMVDVQNPARVILKNKTPALTGLCPISGTPVFRFVKQHTTMV